MPNRHTHRDHRISQEDVFRRRLGVASVAVGGLLVSLIMFAGLTGFGPSAPGPISGSPPNVVETERHGVPLEGVPAAVVRVRAAITQVGRDYGMANAAACVEADRHLSLSHDGPLADRRALPVSLRHMMGQIDRRCPALERQLLLELLACAAEEGVLPVDGTITDAQLPFDDEALLSSAGCPPLGGLL